MYTLQKKKRGTPVIWGTLLTLQCTVPPKQVLPALENQGIHTPTSTPVLVELAKVALAFIEPPWNLNCMRT